MRRNIYTVGVIGLGLTNPYIYVPMLEEFGVQVGYVWDYNRKRAADFAKRINAETLDDWRECLCKEVDGILIESKNFEHCSLAEPFLEKGIPTFVEKPLSNSFDEARDFLKKASDNSWFLFSCSPLRFSPVYQCMKKAINSKKLGKINLCTIKILHTMEHFINNPSGNWHDRIEEGGGMLIDIGIHGVQILLMMADTDVRSVFARTGKLHYKQAESEDLATILVTFEDESIGVINLICATEELDYSLWIHGRKKTIMNNRANVYIGPKQYNPENAYGGFRGTMEAFVKLIKNKRVPIEYEEILEVMRVLQAARISSKTRKEVSLQD